MPAGRWKKQYRPDVSVFVLVIRLSPASSKRTSTLGRGWSPSLKMPSSFVSRKTSPQMRPVPPLGVAVGEGVKVGVGVGVTVLVLVSPKCR